MSLGRGSAVAVLLVLCLVALQYDVAQAAVYTVGGRGGWTFNTVGWPAGKQFRAGDVLVFNYNSAFHNVVAVNQRSYKSCNTPAGAKSYHSGRDRITLARGQNYFLCSFPSHCQAGMKIAVSAI